MDAPSSGNDDDYNDYSDYCPGDDSSGLVKEKSSEESPSRKEGDQESLIARGGKQAAPGEAAPYDDDGSIEQEEQVDQKEEVRLI